MTDPVKAPDGHSYERTAIEEAIRINGRSPITRQLLRMEDLVTDYTLKSVIEQFARAPVAETGESMPEVIHATVHSRGVRTQLTLSSPDGEARPLDVCFVVDISGSMQLEVNTASGESDGFSVLDVVKHGITTCTCGLRPQDRASIVVYSTEARVLVPLCRMDAAGKARIKVALAGLDPENSTNIWAGLRLGIEQLSDGGTVFLLTDGQPNCRPPRGELSMLRAACDGRDDIVVNTYGFGYNLDSKLLVELARATQGAYSFIPDIGLVGTVFIHAMANLRTTVRRKLTVSIETAGMLSMPELVKTSWGYVLPIGRITKGQPRDIFFECDQPVTLTVEGVEVTTSDAPPTASDTQDTALGILNMVHIDSMQAHSMLNRLLASVTNADLLEDLKGQVREAIEPSAYQKWGKHYLPSLALAHWTQQSNNFLDKGLQTYGGPTFQSVRDQLDKDFNELPAPRPSHRDAVVHRLRSAGHTVSDAPTHMSSYNSASAPCFAGPCRVKMSDGTHKTCQNITAGDVVETSSGNSIVVCVLKTPCETARLVKIGTLMVTPWHPIKHNDSWTFPSQLGNVDEYACDAVYSFLLEPGHCDMRIENVPCITLAHGIEHDEVASHAFYGTHAVVDAMSADAGFSNGLVVVRSVRRDPQTQLVCGLNF